MELPIVMPEDLLSKAECETLLLPRQFFTIYQDYKRFGYAIVESLIDVVIYDNGYSRNINFYTPYYTNTMPCFKYSVLNRKSTILLHDNLIELFISYLDEGYYLQYCVDTFYVPNYTQFGHIEHVMLINGYDLEKQCFIAYDFFDFKRFTKQYISFESVLASNEKFNIERNYGIDCSGNASMLEAFQLDDQLIRKPCLDVFRNKIRLFLENSFLDSYEGLNYGIQMFDIMAERLEKENFAPIKHFAFLLSHIFLMSLRMDILYETYHDSLYLSLKREFDELYQKTHVLKNIHMKYTITEKPDMKPKIISGLYEIKQLYAQQLQSLL